jgi:Tfp pilus assembly protein PilF
MLRTLSRLAAPALALLFACGSPQSRDDEAVEQSDFHLNLARGHFAAHEMPQAIRELYVSLELRPDNVDALFLLGFIHQGRMEYTEAEDYYLRALAADEDRLDVVNNLGTVYLTLRDWPRAEDLFTRLVSEPTYLTPGTARNNLGWAIYNQGRTREALDLFEQALLFQPDLCQAYNNAGTAHADLGDWREAIRRFEDAIERCATYAEPRYRLGVLIADSDPARARALFDECHTLGPDSTWGRRCGEYLH